MTTFVSLEAKDLWFHYPDGPPVLRGISLQIEQGAFVALIGQNGSGKSTLAKHFNGLLRPAQGQVLLRGAQTHDQPVGVLAREVGYVFQNPDHQIFSAMVREEVAFGPRNLGLNEEEVERRVSEALSYFGLSAYAERQPAVLGFGLRRKVSIAAVYAMRTPILILDEPTTGLDWKSTTELLGHVCEMNRQGHTIVLITHDMRVVAEYVPRCILLDAGQVVADDDPRTLFKQADRLQKYRIEPPQVTRLAQRMTAYGLPEDALTVAEFCEAYDPNVLRRQHPVINHADSG